MDTEIQTSNTSEEITPRKNTLKSLVILLVTLLLITIFGSAALYLYFDSKQTETNNSNDEASVETNNFEKNTEDTSSGKETVSTYYNYVEYKDDDTSFLYPEGWEVEVSKEVEYYQDGYEPDPDSLYKINISDGNEVSIKLTVLSFGIGFTGGEYYYNPDKPLSIDYVTYTGDSNFDSVEYTTLNSQPIITWINSINRTLIVFPEEVRFIDGNNNINEEVSTSFARKRNETYGYPLDWSVITIVEGTNLKGFKPILTDDFNKVIIDAKCPSQSMDDAKRCTELITTFLESLGEEEE